MNSLNYLSIRLYLWVLMGVAMVVVELVWADSEQVLPVTVDQTYRQPSAFAGPDRVVVVGETVEFFGQGTSADAEIIEYAWDFDADGVPDFVSNHPAKTTYRFITLGDYQCILTVKDSLGRVARDSRRIIVVAEPPDLHIAQQMLQPSLDAVSNPPDGVINRYAVMINGGSETRFWTDVELELVPSIVGG